MIMCYQFCLLAVVLILSTWYAVSGARLHTYSYVCICIYESIYIYIQYVIVVLILVDLCATVTMPRFRKFRRLQHVDKA